MGYRLFMRQGTETFRRIMHGRKWVGRVYEHADGSFRAMINKQEVGRGTTAVEAFEMGVSRHLGYASVHDLNAQNRKVRALRKARRQHAQHVFSEMLRGNFDPLDKLMSKEK